jgi:hypothetical protein
MKRDKDEWGTPPEFVPGDQGEDEQLDMWGTWPGLAPGDQGFMNCLKPYSEPSRTAAAGSLRSERGGARTRAEDAARPYRPADARVAICCICDREVPESQLTVRPSGSPVHRCDLCQAISMVQSVVSGSRLSEDKEFEAVAKLSEIYHSLYNSAKQDQGEDLCQAISMAQSVVSGSRLSEDTEFEAVAKLSEIDHSLYNSAK